MDFNIAFVLIALVAVVYIFLTVRSGKLSIDESFLWALGAVLVLFLAIDPKIIDRVASLVGVDYPPSLLFVGCIVFLLLINIRLSQKVASQQEKIIRLAQDVSILKDDRKARK